MHSVEWDNVTISTCICSSIKGATETLQMLWHRTFNSDTPLLVEKKNTKPMSSIKHSRLSLSRSQKDPLKHFDISVLGHIRCAELRNIPNEQSKFTNEHVI